MDIDFESYIRDSEPDKKEKASAWKTAIGLQAVDGLQTSDYLKDTAIKHLRSIGFDVNNDLFADNSWYFRNALVRANYRNVRKEVEPDMSFLILFFRNLMMGENHELKNRYMIINAPQQSTEQANRISTEQVPNKLTEQLTAPLLAIVKAIGIEQCSLKVIMERIELKHRPTFIANYLTPAIQNGFVAPLYPNNPKHPRQKYLLTVKGLAIFNSTK